MPDNPKTTMNKLFGLLIVISFSIGVGLAMLNQCKGFDKKATDILEEYKKNQKQELNKIDGLTLTDDSLNHIVGSAHFLNAEAQNEGDNYLPIPPSSDQGEYYNDLINHHFRDSYQDARAEGILGYLEIYENGILLTSINEDGMLQDLTQAKKNLRAILTITFDENGVPSITDNYQVTMTPAEEDQLLSSFTNITIGEYLRRYAPYIYEEIMEDDASILKNQMPLIKNAVYRIGYHPSTVIHSADYSVRKSAYMMHGYLITFFSMILIMAALALLLQNIPYFHLKELRLFRLPTELIIIILSIGLGVTLSEDMMTGSLGIGIIHRDYIELFREFGVSEASLPAAGAIFGTFFWSLAAFCYYFATASILPYLVHPIRSLKENCLCIKLLCWIKNKGVKIYRSATEIRIDSKYRNSILRLLGLNFVIVSFLCILRFWGIIGAVIYSGIIFYLSQKKLDEISHDYEKVHAWIKKIASGDLSGDQPEDLGFFSPIQNEIGEIQNGFKKAVEDEVRSRNMKTELITNVSHDLKTPLTAIITYIDLLKNQDITEEERQEYLETLDKKAGRLKVLIEDLFEISKATSNSIIMNYADVNLTNFMKEVRLENEEKITESKLDFRWKLPEGPCMVRLDPNRTYRIIDNLIQNIFKYALNNSRVYIDMEDTGDQAIITFRNISAEEINFTADHIVERFVRGDHSRNSEGSGLGLAIAQSFTELQGGEFKIDVDGDLFKVTVSFHKE